MRVETRYRSVWYLRYVSGQESCLTWGDACIASMYPPGSPQLSVAHHVRMGGNGGMGLKPSDYRTVPLTDQEHRTLHQHGEKSFWREAGVDPDQVIIALLARFCGVDPQEINSIYPDDPKIAISHLEQLADVGHKKPAHG